jgi:uncharacterized protein YjbJ (UPF0337 family)
MQRTQVVREDWHWCVVPGFDARSAAKSSATATRRTTFGCDHQTGEGNRLAAGAFLAGRQAARLARKYFANEETVMSGTSDKIKGYANEAVGNIKQGVGKLVGSDKMKAEGMAQEVKGDAQKAVGNVKDKASDAYDSATSSSTADKASGHANDAIGNVKQTVGRAVGSDRLEAEGLAQEAKGEAQKISGDVKKTFGR